MVSENPLKQAIINFINDLSIAFENNTLTDHQQLAITEIFIKFLFLKLQNTGDNRSAVEEERIEQEERKEEEDFMKFLTLGWYVYNNLMSTSHH